MHRTSERQTTHVKQAVATNAPNKNQTRSRYLLVLILFFPSLLWAQAPARISYQGYLTDNTGTAINTPTTTIVKFFDASSGGTMVWRRTYTNVPVDQGYYALVLENGTPTLAEVSFDKALWVEVTAGGELQSPRTALSMVPYAQSLRHLRVVPASEGPNLIGGFEFNEIVSGVVGATIGGGGIRLDPSTVMPNKVFDHYATIAGGVGNIAGSNDGDIQNAQSTTIGGGKENKASHEFATISGGWKNETKGNYATIGGGVNNSADVTATIGGGDSNTASPNATVGGGLINEATGFYSTIAGGWGNVATTEYATVGGGVNNRANGEGSIVPGGSGSEARGDYSFAAGYNARAKHDGAFVWNDRSITGNDSLVSSGANQFLIRAAGGVGIGTNTPLTNLHIKQSESTQRSGIRLEYQNNAHFWDTYIDVANDYNFAYNATLIAYINEATGEYIDNVPSAAFKTRRAYGPVLKEVGQLRALQAEYGPEGQVRPVLDVAEVERFLPDLIVEKNGQKAVVYQRLGVVAIQAIQELEAQVAQQNERLAELEQLVEELINK